MPGNDLPAVTRTTWNGYERLDFPVGGRACILVRPDRAAEGRPWIWRTEFFGHEPQADLALLDLGFHAAYIDVQDMYGAPVALDHMDAFYDHLVTHHRLSPKVVLEGFSRGGLFAFNWAARHPDRVACIYADAPVCDFKSWPAARAASPVHPRIGASAWPPTGSPRWRRWPTPATRSTISGLWQRPGSPCCMCVVRPTRACPSRRTRRSWSNGIARSAARSPCSPSRSAGTTRTA